MKPFIDPDAMKQRVTFQRKTDIEAEWSDFITCRAYINGLSGNEFFTANMGYEAALIVNISCRFQPSLMKIIPEIYRAVCGSTVYEILSPADDVKFMHREIKFRAKRIYTEADGT